eukprot:2302364-Lingulodinium_polyedra.AAC.1
MTPPAWASAYQVLVVQKTASRWRPRWRRQVGFRLTDVYKMALPEYLPAVGCHSDATSMGFGSPS